jgi:hypothetical protein
VAIKSWQQDHLTRFSQCQVELGCSLTMAHTQKQPVEPNVHLLGSHLPRVHLSSIQQKSHSPKKSKLSQVHGTFQSTGQASHSLHPPTISIHNHTSSPPSLRTPGVSSRELLSSTQLYPHGHVSTQGVTICYLTDNGTTQKV